MFSPGLVEKAGVAQDICNEKSCGVRKLLCLENGDGHMKFKIQGATKINTGPTKYIKSNSSKRTQSH